MSWWRPSPREVSANRSSIVSGRPRNPVERAAIGRDSPESRQKVKLPRQTAAGIERFLRENGSLLGPAAVAADACRDADDMHILGLAKAGKADYLVTGDDDLLVLKRFGRCRIVTPRQFWSLMHR